MFTIELQFNFATAKFFQIKQLRTDDELLKFKLPIKLNALLEYLTIVIGRICLISSVGKLLFKTLMFTKTNSVVSLCNDFCSNTYVCIDLLNYNPMYNQELIIEETVLHCIDLLQMMV